MTAAKVAITVSADVLRLAKKRVKAGRAKSLSAFVNDAVDEKLRRDELTELLDALDAKRGPPSKAAKAWAKRVLARSS
jgi:Arc/MetJ-type ribon-helix-helix transcriptional regulator